jgi:hypothetical protein
MEEMSKSRDEDLLGIVYEFFLNIYSSSKEKELPINNFIKLLSDKSKRMYEESVNTWLKGNE